MTIELRRDLDLDYGLRAGLQMEVYEGFGAQCGTTRADGTPTGDVWVRCPTVPVVRNRAGDIVSWKSAFVILKPTDFAVVAATKTPTEPNPTEHHATDIKHHSPRSQ